MRIKSGIVLLILIFFISSCATKAPLRIPVMKPENQEQTADAVPVSGNLPDENNSGLAPVSENITNDSFLTIVAAGDNLFHSNMIRDGEKGDYESIYDEIKTLVEPADIAFINQETVLGGEAFGFSGYPKFNTPQAVGQALADTGFNVINHANNHAMDMGEKAVLATLDFWDTIPEVSVLGVHRSEKDLDQPVLITRNNITLGFLSYTYGTNNIPLPAGKPYLVSRLNTETMKKEIDALRPLCDFLVVSMHWGEEYQMNHDKNQERLAAFLAEHLVDLVIGHHPHVIQEMEYIPRPDGRTMLCFYSLGNFISAQTRNQTLLGALAYIKIKKSSEAANETAADNVNGAPDGKAGLVNIVITEAGVIPLVNHHEKNYSNMKIYPLYAYSEELMEKHLRTKDITLDYFKNLASGVLGEKVINLNPFSPEPDLYQ